MSARGNGVADRDSNSDGVYDCKDPVITTLSLTKPKTKLKKSVMTVTMQVISGVKYELTYKTLLKGAKKARTKTIKSAKNVLSIKGIKAGSTITLSYHVLIDGSPVRKSPESPSVKVKVKKI